MNLIKRVINRLNFNRRIGDFLRSHYASFRVTRPYIIKVDEHDELKGKVAIITGGSGAIGRACAFRLAAEGAKVYVCGSRPTSAQPVANEIIESGKSAVAIQLNRRAQKPSLHKEPSPPLSFLQIPLVAQRSPLPHR